VLQGGEVALLPKERVAMGRALQTLDSLYLGKPQTLVSILELWAKPLEMVEVC